MIISRRRALATTASAGLSLLGCKMDAQRPEERPARRDEREAPGGDGSLREVRQVLSAQPTKDGAGVSLKRALGGRALGMLDPFLLLDEFQSDDPNDYLAGFPEHPHRGFETVTYMIQGAMEHADSVGNRGRLGPGSAQWMTAGRGIVHSEMPKQERGLMWGFQLWVNLPRAHKMMRPRYQDIAAARIPELAHEGARVRVVAGMQDGLRGPVDGIDVEPLFLDVALERGSRWSAPIPSSHNAFVYVTDGAARLGSSRTEARRGQLAVLTPTGTRITATCDADGGARMLVIAGRPLGEPVARGGPFVMSTDEELRQAWDDYRSGRLVAGG